MCTKFRYIPGSCTRPWTQCCVAVYDLGFRLPSGTCSRDRIGFCPAPLPISHSSGILLHAPILCPSPSPGAQPDTPSADVSDFVPRYGQIREHAHIWSPTTTKCKNMQRLCPSSEPNLMHYETRPELCLQGPAKISTCLDLVLRGP